MDNFDVIIVGGGAAGSICAMTILKKCKKSILMIDENNKPAKKIMVTGNGRCNLSNRTCMPSKNFYNQNIDNFLSRFNNNQTTNFFESIGLICYSDSEGRIYPITNSAKTVVDVINNELEKHKNFTYLSDFVEKIDKKGEKYVVFTSNGAYMSEKLVIALGGRIDKDLINLDIKFIPFKESLVALKTNSTHFLNGIRVSPARVSVNKENFYEGEILFKESGISGIAVFNLSSYFSHNKNFTGEVEIDLLPQFSDKDLIEMLLKRREINCLVNKFFDGLLVPQLAYHILNESGVDEHKNSVALSEEEIKIFIKKIKHFKLKVKSCYDNNQIMSGGVDLKTLTENLESKKYKNLYFCGEICDVDGICGGYNLQWAWTSGYIVGEAI